MVDGLHIRMKGSDILGKKLKGVEKELSDLRPLLEEFRNGFAEIVKKNIASKGPPGAKWKPLDASTILARKERVGYYVQSGSGRGGSHPLSWTGSIEKSFQPGARYASYTIRGRGTDYEIRMGSNHPLVALHHHGAKGRRGKVEAKKGKRLRMLTSRGIFYARSAKPATFRIPARPFFMIEQVIGLMNKTKPSLWKRVKRWFSGN